MASTYTLNNGIELIGTGEQSGTWGDTTNTNLSLVDTALDGQVTVTLPSAGTSGSPNTLAISDGAASDGRNRMVIFNDGGDLGATAYVQLTPNDAEKIIYIRNDLAGSRSIILFQGTYNASNDYELPAGTTAVIYFDGAGSGAVAANVFNNAYFDSLRLGSVSVTAILDEDDMSSDSATALATQQSIKAYVDTQITAEDLDFAGDSGTGAVDLDSQSLTIAGTSNEIETSASGQTLTIGLPDDVTITGDLTVDTDTLYVDSTNDRVGINTSSPSYAIDVVGLTDNSIYAEFSNNSSRALRLSSFAVGANDNAGHDFNASSSVGALSFSVDENEAMRIDSSQRVLIGGQSDSIAAGGIQALLQVEGTAGDASFSLVRHSASVNSSYFTFGKSRGADATIVQNGDNIGFINFAGADGTDINSYTAYIASQVDGTPGSNDMPGRLTFYTTADGANTPTERMRINSSGYVGIGGGFDPGAPLDVRKGSTGTIAEFRGANTDLLHIDGDSDAITLDARNVSALNFEMQGTQAMRINSSRQIVMGYAAVDAQTFSLTPKLQVIGNDASNSAYQTARFQNGAFGSYYQFAKSRSTTVGGNAIVQDGDAVGNLRALVDDGTDYNSVIGAIEFLVDGTPGTNDTPGRISFQTTPDGSSGPTERMRITNGGRVGINTVGESGAPLGWLTIDNDINSANVLTNKASYHLVLGLDGGVTNHYIGGIGFGDVVTSTIQAAITAVDAGTSAATSLAFATGNTSAVNEAMRIDASQRVLIGDTTGRSGFGKKLEIMANDSLSSISLVRASNSSGASAYLSHKSRGTLATPLIVQDDDNTLQLTAHPYDGTDYGSQSARISMYIDGTPGANDTPGRILFETAADGSSTVNERMRIDSDGFVGVGETDPDVRLHSSINTATEWNTIYNLSNSNNLPIYALGLYNNDTSITNTEVNLLFSAGSSGSGQHSIGVKRTGTNTGDLIFRRRNGGSSVESMRVTNSGNLLINRTDTGVSVTTSGIELNDSGYISASRSLSNDSGAVGYFNRLDSTAGDLIQLRIDGIERGVIGITGTDNMYMASSDGLGWKINADASRINMSNASGTDLDGAADIGGDTSRIKDIKLSGGIYLGGVTSSNKLDDVEEGTFIPHLYVGGTQQSLTRENGYYSKVGNLVNVSIGIILNGAVSGSGTVELRNFPYNSKGGGASGGVNARSAGSIGYTDATFMPAGILMGANTSTAVFYRNAVAGTTGTSMSSALQGSDLPSNFNIHLSITYNVQ